MRTETPRAEVALAGHPDGETPCEHSAAPSADEALAQQFDQLPAAKAKLAIINLKMRGEVSSEEAQRRFNRRPELRTS